MATSVPCQQAGHSLIHVGGFCWWVDGRDQNRIDFPFLRDYISSKINLGTRLRIDPKCRDQKCIFA